MGKREVGWKVGMGAGWGAKSRLYHTVEQKSSRCVFIEVHKQPQFTCQITMVTDSSLTPSVALLVHPRSTVYFIVDFHEFTGSQK